MGAMPGKIIQCLKKTKTENPLVLIDEVGVSFSYVSQLCFTDLFSILKILICVCVSKKNK